MRVVKLPELLIDVDNELHFTQNFMPPAEQESPSADHICAVLATIMAHGCNIGAYTMITLFERFKSETWEAKPGCLHLRLLSDGQIQTANRKQVCGWAEVMVEIAVARYCRTLCSVEPPAPRRINGQLYLDYFVSDPTRHLSGYGLNGSRWINRECA